MNRLPRFEQPSCLPVCSSVAWQLECPVLGGSSAGGRPDIPWASCVALYMRLQVPQNRSARHGGLLCRTRGPLWVWRVRVLARGAARQHAVCPAVARSSLAPCLRNITPQLDVGPWNPRRRGRGRFRRHRATCRGARGYLGGRVLHLEASPMYLAASVSVFYLIVFLFPALWARFYWRVLVRCF